MPRRFDAVIFDMDGVLLDSEPLHFAMLHRVLGESDGFSLSESENEEFLGATIEKLFTTLSARHGLRLSIAEYIERYETAVLRALEQPLASRPGVRCLIDRLCQMGMPLAVASSSRRSWVEATLRSLGLREAFPIVVSGDDVAHSKPDPEIYVLTAARLGVRPCCCLAIEDAPNGVASATGAGVSVLGVRTPYTAHLKLDGVLRTVDSLADLDLDDLEGVLERL